MTKISWDRLGRKPEVKRYRDVNEVEEEEELGRISERDRKEFNREKEIVDIRYKRCTNMKTLRRHSFVTGPGQ